MKSYKDLPREVVLNAPDGAMWISYYGEFYKFVCGAMFVFQNEWVRTADHKLSNWTHCDEPLIPLPNVKIPWEATEDSVCPVPDDCFVLIWFNNNPSPYGDARKAMLVRWLKRDGDHNITSYRIINAYMSASL